MRRMVQHPAEPKRVREIDLYAEDGGLVGTYKTPAEVGEKIGVAANAVSRALGSSGRIKGHTVSYTRQGLEFTRQNPSASMTIPRGLSGPELEKFKRKRG